MGKKIWDFRKAKKGSDVVDFAASKGAQVEHGHKVTKVIVPGRGSFLVNETKELSKHDWSHYRRILTRLGLLVIFFMFLAKFVMAGLGLEIIWF